MLLKQRNKYPATQYIWSAPTIEFGNEYALYRSINADEKLVHYYYCCANLWAVHDGITGA